MTEPRQPYRNPLSTVFGELANRGENSALTELFRDPLDPGYAEAARRRAVAGNDQPRRWRGGMRAATAVTLVAIGLLFAVAYRQVVAEEPTRSQVRADLEEQIHQREAETQALQGQVEDLRDQVAQLRDQQLGNPAAVRQLRELEAATGLSRVAGDGVVVRVADGPPGVDPNTGEAVTDPQARILDRDLQQLANALWAAGAEAVAINDRRLTATSTIRTASGAVLIDRQPIASPYELAAIGPDDLSERFEGSAAAGLMRLLVDEFGITYEVREASDLSLPGASEPELRYATPTGGS